MRLYKEELEMALDDFTKEVQAKRLRRIDYSAWKDLKKADTWFIDICEPYDGIDMPMLGISDKNGNLLYEDEVYDGSICQFLFEEMVREGDIMPPKDYYDQIVNSSNVSNTLTWFGTPGNTYSSTSTSYSYTYDYVSKNEFDTTIASLDAKLASKEDKKTTNVKENSKMKGFNFDFGPCNNSAVKISVYGLAVKNTNGTYVSYDSTSGNLMDVDILNFDGSKFLYKMPVAIKDVKVGDIVIHNRVPMFVTSIGSDAKTLVVVDPVNGEKKEIMLTRSPFGFDFATKIVNIIGNMSADANNPFGNMWMFALASGDGKDTSFADLAPLMLMSQGSLNIDPMMMYVLASGGKNDSLLPLMLMMNKSNTPAHTCNCGGHCHEVKEN